MAAVNFDLSLHDAQREVWESDARFRVVACGRRFGKTHLGTAEIVRAAFEVDGSTNWWVAPVHDQSDVAFRMFLEAVPPALYELNLTKKLVILKHNNSRIQWKSADREQNLRAEGLNFLVLDEGAYLKAAVWYGSLRPSLSDRRGKGFLIGTFDGDENWFYQEYEQGQSLEFPDYESWRFPTSANPYIDAEEIEAARRTLPKAEFEQEYMANPLSYVGAVFEGEDVQRAIDRGRDKVWQPEFDTFAGVDWGYANPTAFEVCNQTPDDYVRWVYEKLWYSVELNERCHEIALMARQYQIRVIYADAAGKDENVTLAKHLSNYSAKTVVVPVPFNKYKEAGITARRWFLETGREDIGPQCKQLGSDTKRYRYKEGKDEVEKVDDHTVDATIAFYATRFPQSSGRVK